MNRESSETHLEEIKKILKEFVERYDILGEHERKYLVERAEKELDHIDSVISYVHTSENE
jgi:predicted metal-dependent enzyme (double-stranded beta helix superfamily)